MKKKAEVIEILNQGGRIMVDTIYRTARVYTAAEWESDSSGDSCRYDVAESLAKMAGYKKVKTDWYASYHIVKEAAAETEKTAAEWEAESERVHEEVSAWCAQVFGAAEEAAPAAEALTPYERVMAKNPDCQNAWRLPGYPGPVYAVSYDDGRGASITAHFPSVYDFEEELERCRKNGYTITKTTKTENGKTEDIPAETRQEKTDRENREHCQRIAEDVEAYAAGNYYKCPDCCGVHHWDAVEESEHEDEAGWAVYTCPDCGAEIAEDDWEQQSLYDYFSDCYDIEYRCDSKREYRSVCIMVACGGPNIYIDTSSKAVELYWWTDRARYYLSSDAVDAVDDWAREYWDCL